MQTRSQMLFGYSIIIQLFFIAPLQPPKGYFSKKKLENFTKFKSYSYILEAAAIAI